MFGSKWLIYSCAIALIAGVAIISPLLILNTVSDPSPENPPLTANPQSADSQIGVNIKSIQTQLGNTTTPIDGNSTEAATQISFSGNITLNATKYLNSKENVPLAESDLFLMEIYTDNGTLIRNCTLNIGTAYNESFTPEQHRMLNFSIVTSTSGRLFSVGELTFVSPWPIGTSQENTQEFSGNVTSNMAALIDSSQTLNITISRIGTITVRDNSVAVGLTNAGSIETVTLTRSGNTFTYSA